MELLSKVILFRACLSHQTPTRVIEGCPLGRPTVLSLPLTNLLFTNSRKPLTGVQEDRRTMREVELSQLLSRLFTAFSISHCCLSPGLYSSSPRQSRRRCPCRILLSITFYRFLLFALQIFDLWLIIL